MKATRVCSVEGCDALVGPKGARGLCSKHYRRWRNHGTTDEPLVPSVADRLAAGLERKPNGCLEWTGYTDPNGYGQIRVDGRNPLTHRLAWELAHGPIPDGLNILHHCDNPPCCDAIDTEHHLFLGTQADNLADMAAKGRHGKQSITHCPQGHEYTEANTRIHSNGGRNCRACHRDTCARYREKRRNA